MNLNGILREGAQMANQGGGKGGDPKKKGAGNFNEMILGGLKSRAGKETTRWVKGITQDAEELVLGAVEKRDAGPAPSSALQWIDKLFDLFQQYEVELNRVTSDHPELRLGSERPVFTQDLIVKLENNPKAEFRGRVYTREWTLAISGNFERVEGHIIPSQHFIAFTANESNYTKYFEIRPVNDGNVMKWTCDGGIISWDRLPTFAKQVLGGLIHVARGEATEHDQFIFNPEGLEAIRIKPAEPEHPTHFTPFNDQGPELASDAPPDSMRTTSETRRPSTIPRSEQGANLESMIASVRQEAIRESNLVREQRESSDAKAPAQQEPLRARAGTATKHAHAAQTNPVNSDLAETAEHIGVLNLTLAEACDLLSMTIDRELEALSRSGAKAFESHDFAAVERALKKSTKIKQLRDEIHSTLNQWKAAINVE